MASLRSKSSFIFGGLGDPKKAQQQAWSKTPQSTTCRPPARTGSPLNPIHLANDILEVAYNLRKGWDGERNLSEETVQYQYQKLKNAQSAKEWKQAADKLDILEGNHYWKFDEESEDCDLELVRKRLDSLKQANHDNNMEEMLVQIRHALKRDLGGMCNARLYQHTWLGTKHLIEEYTDVVNYTIERLAKYCQDVDAQTLDRYLETIKAARQSFGNSALMLSGGGTLGMCHIGVVKCLLDAGLLPKVVCGASAGSIVASVLCTHKGSELIEKLDELCSGDLSVFQGANELKGIPGMAVNILKGDPAFNVGNLCRVMKGLLRDITFKEAYNYTGMALNIHVSCRDKYNLPRLLNYVTAPNVVIWTAVASSCALPFVFEAPGLKAKNLDTQELEPWGHFDHKWIDGSIEGDLPAQLLERLFNVNNFLASQVNPHVGPLLPKEGVDPGFIRKTLTVGSANTVYFLDGLMEGGWDNTIIKMAHSVLSQKYDGDITILPDISWVPLAQILANPTQQFMTRATREGERATWPKLDRIKNSVSIELALDACIKEMQTKKVEGLKHRRPASSTRSERGLAMMRRKSGGPGGIDVLPRISRGRTNIHRPIRSMIDTTSLLSLSPPQKPATMGENIFSSSEGSRSGQSSPITSYDEEGHVDGIGSDADDDLEPTAEERQMLAFLSQPSSPSISMKTYWGNENRSAQGQAHGYTSPVPPSPPSPEVRRALSGLHMSSIVKKMKPMSRKDSKH